MMANKIKPVNSSAAIPVTDPTRPCWHFLSEVLGRRVSPRGGEEACQQRLRDLLEDALAEHPYKLLMMALLSNESCRGKMIRFVDFLKDHSPGTTAASKEFMSLDPTGGERLQILGDPHWREAFDYMISHMWIMGDGSPTEDVRGAAYWELGPPREEPGRTLPVSTKEPVRAWLPEKLGVIRYLQARMNHILLEFYEDAVPAHRMLSMEQLQDGLVETDDDGHLFQGRRLDVNESGEVVRAVRGGQHSLGFMDLKGRLDKQLGLVDDTEPQPPREGCEGKPTKTPKKRFAERLKAVQAEFPGDWPLRMFDRLLDTRPMYMHKPSRLVASGRRVLAELAMIDNEIASDAETINEAFRRWDGTPPFAEAFPEITVACEKWKFRLAGLDERRRNNGLRLLDSGIQAARGIEIECRTALRLDGDDPSSDAEHSSLCGRQCEISEVLTFRDVNPESLSGPSFRPDYVFLAQESGEVARAGLSDREIADEMRRLKQTFCVRLESRGLDGRRISEEIRGADWDPARESFGDVLLLASHRVSERFSPKKTRGLDKLSCGPDI